MHASSDPFSIDRPDPKAVALLTAAQARALHCIPLGFRDDLLVIGAADAANATILSYVVFLTQRDCKLDGVGAAMLDAALDHHYGPAVEMPLSPAVQDQGERLRASKAPPLLKVLTLMVLNCAMSPFDRLRIQRPWTETYERTLAEGSVESRPSGNKGTERLFDEYQEFLASIAPPGNAGASFPWEITYFGDRPYTAHITVSADEILVGVKEGAIDASG
jgi:hypothetical protein